MKTPSCDCARLEMLKRARVPAVLEVKSVDSHAEIGIRYNIRSALNYGYTVRLESNFCPQCGAKYQEVPNA